MPKAWVGSYIVEKAKLRYGWGFFFIGNTYIKTNRY